MLIMGKEYGVSLIISSILGSGGRSLAKNGLVHILGPEKLTFSIFVKILVFVFFCPGVQLLHLLYAGYAAVDGRLLCCYVISFTVLTNCLLQLNKCIVVRYPVLHVLM